MFGLLFNPSLPKEDQFKIFNEAKELEKQQMANFANDYADQVMAGMNKRAEQYYNETYEQTNRN